MKAAWAVAVWEIFTVCPTAVMLPRMLVMPGQGLGARAEALRSECVPTGRLGQDCPHYGVGSVSTERR